MSFLQTIQKRVVAGVAKIKWKSTGTLSEATQQKIQTMLAVDYYIIATKRSNYLTTFFINLGNFLMTRKWGVFSHVLMNLEDEVKTVDDFRLIEATLKYGTKYSTFAEVFHDVDSVKLVKPKNIPIAQWTAALDSLKVYIGRPYDSLFDMKSDAEINCVELIIKAVETIPDYRNLFPNFVQLIADHPTLTPSMVIDCEDFEVAYECIRGSCA